MSGSRFIKGIGMSALTISLTAGAVLAQKKDPDKKPVEDISTQARKDMEQLFGGKVFLEVWVRVRSGWADDEAVLRRLGIDAQ